MRARFTASIGLAAAAVLVLAGCTFLTPQATLKHYDPSDGVNSKVGDLQVSNALVVSDDGTDGNLVMSVLNPTDSDVTLTLQWDGGAEKSTITVDVPAKGSTDFGFPEGNQELLENIGTKPGGLLPLYFQYGDAAGKQLQVPVLDSSLAQYGDLTPTPTPTPTETPGVTPTPDPSATP